MLTQCRLLLPSVQVLFRSIDDPIDSILMDTRVELNDLSVNGTKLRVEVAAAAAAVSEPYEGSKKNGTQKKEEKGEKNTFLLISWLTGNLKTSTTKAIENQNKILL